MAVQGTTTLYLRVPDALAERLSVLAQADRRSLNSEAIVLLERAVRDAEMERQDAS